MGEKSEHLFNPCDAPNAQRLAAKIWELLRRSETFRLQVKQFHALDERAKKESVKYGKVARQYNTAIAEKDAARIAEWTPRYDAVKNRPIRKKTSKVIDAHQKVHPLAALALKWLEKQIQKPLAEVWPKTLAQWEDNFRRDTELEPEIGLWCRIAERFVEFSKSEGLNKAQRQECFAIMLHCSTVLPEQVLEVVTLKALTREHARRAIEEYLKAKD